MGEGKRRRRRGEEEEEIVDMFIVRDEEEKEEEEQKGEEEEQDESRSKRGRVLPLITENEEGGREGREGGRERQNLRTTKSKIKRKRTRPTCEHEEDVALLMTVPHFALAVSRRE